MKKRVISKLLAAVLVSVMTISMAACGGSSAPSSEAEKESSAAEQSAAPAESSKEEAAPAESSKEEAAPAEEPAAKEISVGWINATMSNSFYKVLVDTAQAEAEALGWKFTYVDSQMDTSIELAAFEDMIASNVDMIFVDCVDPSAVAAGIALCNQANIPVIAADNTVDANCDVVTSIMSDNIGLGEATGEWACGQIDKDTPIKALELSGQQGNQGNLKRRTGFWAGMMAARIKAREGVDVSVDEMYQYAQEMEQDLISNGRCYDERTDFEVMMQTFGGFTEAGGLQCMEDMLTAHPDANLLIVEADPMGIGALQAINARGLGDDSLVCCVADGSKAALEKIKEGEMDECGQNNPAVVAKLSIQTGKEILVDGVDPNSYDEFLFTPPVAIHAGNIDEYYDPNSEF